MCPRDHATWSETLYNPHNEQFAEAELKLVQTFMRKTFPLPQLLEGSKRATSAAVSDCAAHSRQLRSLSRLRLLRGVALHHASPMFSLGGVGGWAGSRLGNWGPKFHPREFFESSTRANGGTEKGPPKNVAEAWCCAVCVANTLINHNNGLPGKNSSPSHLIRPTASACSFKAVRLHVSCTHLFGRIATRRLQ